MPKTRTGSCSIQTNARNLFSKTFINIKTDVNGSYMSDGVPAKTDRLNLVVNGAVKASNNSTKSELGDATQLNCNLRSTSASQASAPSTKAAHWVCVPAFPASRVDGLWVE